MGAEINVDNINATTTSWRKNAFFTGKDNIRTVKFTSDVLKLRIGINSIRLDIACLYNELSSFGDHQRVNILEEISDINGSQVNNISTTDLNINGI